MGLDMYLTKITKVKNYSVQELMAIDRKMRDFESFEDFQKQDKDYEIIKDIVKYHSNKYFSWHGIEDDLGCWRKANHIHFWFVENVQDNEDDCGYYEVTKEKLIELRDLCKKVLKKVKLVDGHVLHHITYNENFEEIRHMEPGLVVDKPEICDDLLPRQDGFFFGDTDYDEYYIADLKQTIKIINKVLRTVDFEKEYVIYHSSW